VVEGALGGVQLANSLNKLDERGKFYVQRVNPFTEPMELPSGLLVGKFHSIQEEDVGPALEMADEAWGVLIRNDRGPEPEHLV